MRVRRVVTGHSDAAEAVFVSDATIESHVIPGIGFEFLKLWGSESLPKFPDSGTEPEYREYFPPVGGLRFGIFTIAPINQRQLSSEEWGTAISEMERQVPGLLAHMEPSNPGMHTSDSVDFGYVISGSVWLELDDGNLKELHAGDTYIQNGTRHAWRNRGTEPCSILVVVIGTNREPSGLSLAQRQR